MAYDKELADRVRLKIDGLAEVEEKRMFGGIGYMLRGNMAWGIHGDRVIVRVGPGAYQDALAQPGAAPFDLSGRPMRGWVWIEGENLDDAALDRWIRRGLDFAQTLPLK